MAETAEAPELTTAQKISRMKSAGYVPQQEQQEPQELTTAQKIAKMQAAGYIPQQAEPGAMDSNINVLQKLPIVGGLMGGDVTPNDMIHGAINDLPLVGGVVGGAIGGGLGAAGGLAAGGAASVPLSIAGGSAGAGLGGAAGNALKDTLNHFLYGEKKPLIDSVRDAAVTGGEQALGAGVGETAAAGIGMGAKAALATSAGSKVGSLISGVSSDVVKTYAAGAQRIKDAFQSANESTFRMGRLAKKQFGQDLAAARSTLNSVVEAGIQGSEETVESSPIISRLEEAKARLSPKLDAEQISQIEDQIDKVKAMSTGDGSLTVQDANTLKTHLQGIADAGSAYGKAAGLSGVGSDAANAAKGAAAVTRKQMLEVVPKSAADALAKEHALHVIEDSMNKALLVPRKSANALIDAGTNAGGKNAADLQDIQQITGTNMTGPAQDVAAAHSFGKYAFSPSVKGLGQPALKGVIDAATAAATGGGSTFGSTLGQSVMHGTGAMNSLRPAGAQP